MTATDVKAIRERLGLTQEQLAERMGVTHAAICQWERGKRTPSGMAVQLLRTLDEPIKKTKELVDRRCNGVTLRAVAEG